jgi:hypothetical protein
MQSY